MTTGSAFNEYLGGDYNSNDQITITWSCIPPSEVTVELYGAAISQNLPLELSESYAVRETIITSNTSHTFSLVPYGVNDTPPLGTRMYVVITPSGGLPVTGQSLSVRTGS
jgi:hypothetical protein